jgi:DNA-binding NtrC family response regulator
MSSSSIILGHHPLMERLRAQIERAARLPAPVLIEGPTGSGKELVARELHRLSRRSGALVCVNAAAIPEPLATAELFGVMRGAFTGAEASRPGRIEEARNGTLYLDEACDLPLGIQANLLRAFETGETTRLGSGRVERVPFRLVVSVQRPSDELVAEGRWRPDFFYRIAAIRLRVPSLNERATDIPVLARHFLFYLNVELDRDVDLDRLADYPWPGNVRQLRLVLERAIFASPEGVLSPDALEEALELEFRSTVRWNAPFTLSEFREMIATRGDDLVALGRDLQMSRATLYRLLRRAGIRKPRKKRGLPPSV